MDRPTALIPRHYVAIGGHGPEDVVADARGRILTGVEDGRILRIDRLTRPPAARVEVLAKTGGRPLGLELLPDGALLVCDAERGLLGVDLADGTVRVVADEVEGERLRFTSNVVALSDGSVYFTVSSRRYRSCGLSRSESAQPHAPNGLGRTGPRRTQPRGSDTDPVRGPIPGGRFPHDLASWVRPEAAGRPRTITPVERGPRTLAPYSASQIARSP